MIAYVHLVGGQWQREEEPLQLVVVGIFFRKPFPRNEANVVHSEVDVPVIEDPMDSKNNLVFRCKVLADVTGSNP